MSMARIIALDLGKFKTVACVMNALDRSHVFETIEMSPTAVHDLLARYATEPDGVVAGRVLSMCASSKADNGPTFNGRHRADRLSVSQNARRGAGPFVC